MSSAHVRFLSAKEGQKNCHMQTSTNGMIRGLIGSIMISMTEIFLSFNKLHNWIDFVIDCPVLFNVRVREKHVVAPHMHLRVALTRFPKHLESFFLAVVPSRGKQYWRSWHSVYEDRLNTVVRLLYASKNNVSAISRTDSWISVVFYYKISYKTLAA